MPPALAADVEADVCVVGAGIAGLTTAYELARAGRSVVMLDDGPPGGGETGRTTAHVATAVDDYYHKVARMHGARAARLLAESFTAGVEAVERIVRDEAIACDFLRLDGWWFPSVRNGGEERALLERERDAAREAGLADVALVDAWPLGELLGGPALRFPRQAQFHIHKYVAGLVRAVEARGVRVFSGAHVSGIEDAKGDAPCAVTTDAGRTVRARDVVVATNAPINDRFAMQTKQAPYRTYVITARVRRGAVPTGLYWDTAEPYHYVRLLDPQGEGAHDLLLVGGEDHKTGQGGDDEAARFDALEQWARQRFPVEAVEHRWSGQVLEPVDYLAYIGRNPGDRHVWIVTGDSGNGMTHGTIAGLLLPTLIAGEEHPWADLYDPSRITLRAAGEWLKENLNVAAQYADYATGPNAGAVDEVPAGEGRVIRQGTRMLAVYRSPEGEVTVRSAICPHLWCVVDWNSAERTWDCPCHGSRFAPDGAVINGPSRAPLPEASLSSDD
ncbi:FAD-dependent oxidoreductase [Roseisolibacter sp. H3M3-2]|uniref:FAD-dependent oxidoreductase n=1 Tax=Roseisolibacter sp. H3M3-2 TaxID=3031323 RepID=UPI0023DB7C83|nr:FAD-dependent oxidoreductase [Roseisolibacter sp. H3M3-2]MDF1503809.1 FAD-dependent oxidoreductase [Roseisolibacter sp. H3M3-2]